MKTNPELVAAIAAEAQAANQALVALVDAHTRVASLIKEAANRLLDDSNPVVVQPDEPEPPIVGDPPIVSPPIVVPPADPVMTSGGPINVQSGPGLPPFVIENRIIEMGIHTAGISIASPHFWPPSGPKTDNDWNRELTVRNVRIKGGIPQANKDWGANLFGVRKLTLEDVHVEGLLKEHGIYDHNPAGPTVLRRCSFTRNGGQGYQQTRRAYLQPGDNYEGPFVVPDNDDTFYAEDCTFAGNGLDPSRAAWAGAFYAGRYRMEFYGCTFEALDDAPKVAVKDRAGATCVKPQVVGDGMYPGMRHRTGLTYVDCRFASRSDSPRETVLWGSKRWLEVMQCSFAGTKVLIDDPNPYGLFEIESCTGRLPIYVSRGYGKPQVLVGYTDEGISMSGEKMLALLPPEVPE